MNEKYFSSWKCQRCGALFPGTSAMTQEEAREEFDGFEEVGYPSGAHTCDDNSTGLAFYVGYQMEGAPQSQGYLKQAMDEVIANEAEKIRQQFQNPDLFRTIRQHAEDRFGPSPLLPAFREFAGSVEEHKKDRVPFVGKLPSSVEFMRISHSNCEFQCLGCGWRGKQEGMRLENKTLVCPHCHHFNFAMIPELEPDKNDD